MAQIVSSTIAWDNVQLDGTHVVREVWIDDLGNDYVVDYVGAVDSNATMTMQNREPAMLEQITASQAAATLAAQGSN